MTDTGSPTDDARALAAALYETACYGLGATSDVNQQVILQAAKDFEALRRTAPVTGRDREAIARTILRTRTLSDETIDAVKEYQGQTWLNALEEADAILALPQPAETPAAEVREALAELLANHDGNTLDDERRRINIAAHDKEKYRQYADRILKLLSTLPAPVPAGMREALRPFVETMSRMTAAKMIDPTLGPFAPIEVTVTKHQFFTARAALVLPAERADRDQRTSESIEAIIADCISVVPLPYKDESGIPGTGASVTGIHEAANRIRSLYATPPSQSTGER